MKKILTILLFSLTIGLLTLSAGGNTSNTFSYRIDGYFGITQDAYYPNQTITTLGLDGAEEMAFDNNDMLYIADTGNKRVVVYAMETGLISGEIQHEEFEKPKGIFITDDFEIYVADSGAEAIFVFDQDYNLINKFSLF